MDNMLPPEYQTQLDAMQRQQMLAQLMQKQAAQGVQPIQQTRILGKQPLLSALAPAVQSGLGAYMDVNATKEMGDVRQKHDAASLADVARVQGLPEPQAIEAGRTSPFTRSQLLAKAMQEQKDKRTLEIGKMYGQQEQPAQAVAAFNGQPIPAPALRPAPSLNSLPDPNKPGEVIPVLQTTGSKGYIHGQFQPAAPKVELNTGDKQETAVAKAIGGEIPKVMSEIQKEAKASLNQMQSADRLSELLKNPEIITGFAAGAQTGIASLAVKLGFTGPDAVAQTQALLAEQANQTLAQVRKLPGAITEKERPFLELSAAGQQTFTPQAIQRLADISRMVAHNTMMDLQEQYNGTLSSPGVSKAGAGSIWPFPKGWNFNPDGKKYQQIEGTDKFRYIGDNPEIKLPPVSSGSRDISKMTKAEKEAEIKLLEQQLGK